MENSKTPESVEELHRVPSSKPLVYFAQSMQLPLTSAAPSLLGPSTTYSGDAQLLVPKGENGHPQLAWGSLLSPAASVALSSQKSGELIPDPAGGVKNGQRHHAYMPRLSTSSGNDGAGSAFVLYDSTNVDELPGARMARMASRRGEPRPKRSPDPNAAPQSTLTWAPSGDNDCRATTLLLRGRGTNDRRKPLVPFWLVACALMLVPTAFVTVYITLSLNDASAKWNYASETAPLILNILDLEEALLNERLATTQLMAEPAGSATRTAAAANLAKQRDVTDAARTHLRNAALLSSHKSIREGYLGVVRSQLTGLDTLRYAVESDLVLGSAARKQITDAVDRVISGVVVVARGAAVARDYLVVRDVLVALNYAGLCRALGTRVLRAGPALAGSADASGDVAPLFELSTQGTGSLRRSLQDLRIEADGFVATALEPWNSNADAQAMLQIVYGLEASLLTGSGYFPNMTAANYTAMATRAMSVLRGVVVALVGRVHDADDLRQTVMAEGLKLALTLLLSAVGVAVVARAQRMGTARVEAALGWTENMARAVQAFIPQDFLGLMEVESILKLERGDRSLVRIATLFCDIRNFTGISERMSNEQLFDWLQAHLMRMTRTTERHYGFVDKFIGDAVSSVFLRAPDAVRCAVRMQAATDALCFDLVAHNEDQLVRIGVGVHFGQAEVGVLGNEKHLTCVVISPEVNVAAQLESLTKEYGARILITEQVREQLVEDEFHVRPLGEARLSKDSASGFRLFDVYDADALSVKEYKNATVAQWAAVLAAQEASRLDDVQRLAYELRRLADARGVVDPALEIKLRAAAATDDYFFD